MWDNRGTMHRVVDYDATKYRRELHRTELAGFAPVQAPGLSSPARL